MDLAEDRREIVGRRILEGILEEQDGSGLRRIGVFHAVIAEVIGKDVVVSDGVLIQPAADDRLARHGLHAAGAVIVGKRRGIRRDEAWNGLLHGQKIGEPAVEIALILLFRAKLRPDERVRLRDGCGIDQTGGGQLPRDLLRSGKGPAGVPVEVRFVKQLLALGQRPSQQRSRRVNGGQTVHTSQHGKERFFVFRAHLIGEVGRVDIVQDFVFERHGAVDQREAGIRGGIQRRLQLVQLLPVGAAEPVEQPAVQAVGLPGEFFALRQLQNGIVPDALLAAWELVGGIGIERAGKAVKIRNDPAHGRALGERTVLRLAFCPVGLQKPPDEAGEKEAEEADDHGKLYALLFCFHMPAS